MKCGEAEKLIYLYPELTPDERSAVDQHVQSCVECQRIFIAFQSTREVVTTLMQSSPPLHEGQMTSRIMNAINNKLHERTYFGESFVRALFAPSTRYGMVMLSLVLMALFIIEYVSYGNEIHLTKRYPSRSDETVELNLAAIHDVFLKSRRNKETETSSILDCLSQCRSKQSELCKDCVEEKFTTTKKP